MPQDIVNIDLTVDALTPRRPTYSTIAVVGTSDTAPSAGFATPQEYSNPLDVANDFGDGEDVHVSSQAIREMGVRNWWVMQLEEVVTTESPAATSGQVGDAPLLGNAGITTVSIGGSTDTEVIYTTDTGLSQSDASSAATGDAAETLLINMETGEWAGTSSVDNFDYTTVDWDNLDQLDQTVIDLIGLADTKFRHEHIGDLDALVSWADLNTASVVVPYDDGRNYADETEAMTAAHEIGSYVPSGLTLPIAHKSTADVGGYVLGQLGVNEPHFDPFYDGDGYPFETEYYRPVNIGDPETAGTFEGGDSVEQNGKANVVIQKAGEDVLSNSLTTADDDSAYRFFDLARTENFLSQEIEDALEELRLQNDQIPYTDTGRAMILSAIRGRLQQHTGGLGEPLQEFTVSAPQVDEIDQEDRTNRVYPDIQIEGTLAGNVHTFSLTMAIEV